MPGSRNSLKAALSTSALAVIALALSGPVFSQESLLPPGFEDTPAPTTPQQPTVPTPTPAPAPTPSPAQVPDTPTVAVDNGDEDPSLTDLGNEPPLVRYDMPPSARRSLDNFGPLTEAMGGMPADAFGTAGGEYLSVMMRETRAPIASRWASILLRRALISAVDTPETINGADWAAARASLLLRMGEAGAARSVVQSIDSDSFTPRLLNVALATYMANADPGGLCPVVEEGRRQSENKRWDMARSMCAAMSGEAGIASSTIDRLRRSEGETADVLLAQRIVGAGVDGRRAVTIQWGNIDNLDGWRFGLATAAGLDIPDRLTDGFSARMQGWRVAAAMTPIDDRLASARAAASIGVLSNRAYEDLAGFAARIDGLEPDSQDLIAALRSAYTASEPGDRLSAMRMIWGDDGTGNSYGGYVATARAAAALPVFSGPGADGDALIASMLTAGYDTSAVRWLDAVKSGSPAWGMIVLASPEPIAVSSGQIDDFYDEDDSADRLASQFLVAGLYGLGRIEADTADDWADDLSFSFDAASRWTRAIDAAASRGEQGTVAVLAAVGMQGRGWENVSPLHLFHMVRALRQVGLEAEARMIAAEAVART